MADKSFDIVMVGGGSNSLVAAMYLTKFGGLDVGIFEARHELGGGWCTEEPAGGFMANCCSTAMCNWYWEPIKRDIPEWEEYGARTAHGKVGNVTIFSEDHSCLTIYQSDVDPTQELTAREIARFSKKDADTWLWLWDKYKNVWSKYIKEWWWNPAQPFDKQDGLDKLIADPASGADPLWLRMTPMQLYKDLFESIEMRIAFQRPNQSYGVNTSEGGSGFHALMNIVFASPNWSYVIGGTHQLAHAAQRVIIENGGKIFTKHPVKNVIIENGKAKGIRLEDGTEIEARKAVITEVNPSQLVHDMIGKEHLSEKIVRRVDNLESWFINITWYTWCLKERPRYLAEKFNPDCWEGPTCLIMTDRTDEETIVRDNIERQLGMRPSKLHLTTVMHGWHDDDLIAPEGIDFNILTEQFFLPDYLLTDKEWKEFEKTHAEEVIELWQKYAPNMTWDNVIGFNPITPHYTANFANNYGPAGNWGVIDMCGSQMGRCRPIPELASHRTPIKNLYGNGAAWHPMPGAHGIQGYNCYKILSEDLDLKKPWKEKGAPW